MTIALMTLPSFPTAFVGRTAELQEIGDLLTLPDCRLLTLVGPGGMGKTRLAVEAAMQQAHHFPSGVVFVALQPIGADSLLETAILDALKLENADVTNEMNQIIEWLDNRPDTLLILDNFEHHINKIDTITHLLENAPRLKILLTSRTALNIQHEWVRPVLGMSYPDQDDGQTLESYSAPQLFIERAQRSLVFDVDRERAHIIRICQLVGGMPLGIELAAAWMRTLSCEEIADEVQRSLDILETQLRDVPERHRSVRAVFDSSWNMLTAEEKTIFMSLSVFRGMPTREAIQAVTAASVSTLSAFVDGALLTRVQDNRYYMHELLRQYAEEKLEQSEIADTARDAYSRYYLDFVCAREHDLWGKRQAAASEELDADFENIRAAWYRAVDNADEDAIGGAVEPLCVFMWMNARWGDGRFMMKAARDRFAPQDGEQPSLVWGKLLSRYYRKVEDPIALVKQALKIAQHYNSPEDIAMCYLQLGYLNHETRQYDQVIDYFRNALPLFRELGDTYHETAILAGIGGACRLSADYDQALTYLQDAIRIGQETGDAYDLVTAYGELSMLYLTQGDLAEAERVHAEGHKFPESTRHWAVLWMLLEAAVIFDIGMHGNLDDARHKIRRSLALEPAIMAKGTMKSMTLLPQSLLAALEEDYQTAYDLGEATFLHAHGDAWEPYFRWGTMAALAGQGDYDALAECNHSLLTHFHKLRVNTWLLMGVSFAAILAARRDQAPEHATELLALASTHPHALTGWLRVWPLIDCLQKHLQAELGSDAYQAAWERGESLNLDDVVRDLLTVSYQDGGIPAYIQEANRTLIDPLSERELEVLGLIAVGYSNQEIANHLVVGLTTVKKHITHIYSKLDVDSRTKALVRARELQLI